MRAFAVLVLAVTFSCIIEAKTPSDGPALECNARMGSTSEKISGLHEVRDLYHYWLNRDASPSPTIHTTPTNAAVQFTKTWDATPDSPPRYQWVNQIPEARDKTLDVIEFRYGKKERRIIEEEKSPSDETILGFNVGNIAFRHRIFDINSAAREEYYVDFSKASFEEIAGFLTKEKNRSFDLLRERADSSPFITDGPLAFTVPQNPTSKVYGSIDLRSARKIIDAPLSVDQLIQEFESGKSSGRSDYFNIRSADDISKVKELAQSLLLAPEEILRILIARSLYLTGEDAGAAYSSFQIALYKDPTLAQTKIETHADGSVHMTTIFGKIILEGWTTPAGVRYSIDMRSVSNPRELLNFIHIINAEKSPSDLKTSAITSRLLAYGMPSLQGGGANSLFLQQVNVSNKAKAQEFRWNEEREELARNARSRILKNQIKTKAMNTIKSTTEELQEVKARAEKERAEFQARIDRNRRRLAKANQQKQTQLKAQEAINAQLGGLQNENYFNGLKAQRNKRNLQKGLAGLKNVQINTYTQPEDRPTDAANDSNSNVVSIKQAKKLKMASGGDK